jgi:hypothetical protein
MTPSIWQLWDNTIKSIANLSQITHVLTGTYELMMLRHLNGQLSRRSVDIEFNRYLSDNPEHREAFINCLWTFQQHLPLPKTPELVDQWDYFYERSIGCVGVLKDRPTIYPSRFIVFTGRNYHRY